MDHRFLLEIQIPDPNDFFYLLLFFLRFLKCGFVTPANTGDPSL